MTSQESITINPVGYVKTKAVGDEVKNKTVVSEIYIKPEFFEALDGIAEYSHLHILFWLHEISELKRRTLKVQPRGRTDLPFTGVFAVRTNLRPNPIGISIVRLKKIENNIIHIKDLDILDGTPLLDIKPYIPKFDNRRTNKTGWFTTKIENLAATKDDGRFCK